MGRSRGGFGTKIHLAVDGLGNPVEFILTASQQSDIGQAEALLGDREPEAVIADKGYDSAGLVNKIEQRGGKAVIPTLSIRKQQREIDRHLYEERNLVERYINRIKHYRWVATRYDKTGRNFLAFVHVASFMVLLR